MSDETLKNVKVRLDIDAPGDMAEPFEQISQGARGAGHEMKAMAAQGLTHMRTLDRSVLHVAHGFMGLSMTMGEGNHSIAKTMQTMYQLHAAFMLIRGTMEILRAVTGGHHRSTLAAAAANDALAGSATRAAAAERVKAGALAGSAAAASTSAAASAGGGITGAVAGGGLAGAGALLPVLLGVGTGVAAIVGLVSAIKSHSDEERAKELERLSTENRNAAALRETMRLGFLGRETEEKARREIQAQHPFLQERERVQERIARIQDQGELGQRFVAEPFARGHRREDFARAEERMSDLLKGRQHGMGEADRERALARAQKDITGLFGREAPVPPEMKRAEEMARREMVRAQARLHGKESERDVLVKQQRDFERLRPLQLEEEALRKNREELDRVAKMSTSQYAKHRGRLVLGKNESAREINRDRLRMLIAGRDRLREAEADFRKRAKAAGYKEGQRLEMPAGAEVAQAQRDVKQAAEEAARAIEKHAQASHKSKAAATEELKSWRDLAHQQEKQWHQAVRQQEDRIQGLKEQIGGMGQMDVRANLNILKKLQAGRQLTMSEEKFARRSSVLRKAMQRRDLQQFGKNPLAQKLLKEMGEETELKRRQAAEKLHAEIAVKLEQRVRVQLQANEKALADELNKNLVPQLKRLQDELVKGLMLAMKRIAAEEVRKASQGKRPSHQ